MFLFIIIFVPLLIAALGFSIVRTNRRKALEPSAAKEFQSIASRSLFEPTSEEIAVFKRGEKELIRAEQLENRKRVLFKRAENNDFTVLIEAAKIGDARLYEKTLDLLTEKNKTESGNLFRLAAYLSNNTLSATKTFSNALLSEWRAHPQTNALPAVLHAAALTDSAEIYLHTVEATFNLWKRNKLKNITASDLFAVFDVHFRLLPASARASGAGFVLKEKLANIRREVSGKQ